MASDSSVYLMWAIGIGVTIFLAVLGGFWSWMSKQFELLHKRVRESEDLAAQDRHELAKELQALRSEVYRDFTRRDAHEGLVQIFRQDMGEVFNKLDDISKAVHQIQGREEGKREAQQ